MNPLLCYVMDPILTLPAVLLAWLKRVPDSMGIQPPLPPSQNQPSSKGSLQMLFMLAILLSSHNFLWHESNWIDPLRSDQSVLPWNHKTFYERHFVIFGNQPFEFPVDEKVLNEHFRIIPEKVKLQAHSDPVRAFPSDFRVKPSDSVDKPKANNKVFVKVKDIPGTGFQKHFGSSDLQVT